MFTQSKIAALVLTSSLAFATTTQAEEVSLEQYVTGMVNQAMVVAQSEFTNSLRSAVLTVANNVSYNEEKTYTPKVTITDIKTPSIEVDKTVAE